jgi:hypothetical protein
LVKRGVGEGGASSEASISSRSIQYDLLMTAGNAIKACLEMSSEY